MTLIIDEANCIIVYCHKIRQSSKHFQCKRLFCELFTYVFVTSFNVSDSRQPFKRSSKFSKKKIAQNPKCLSSFSFLFVIPVLFSRTKISCVYLRHFTICRRLIFRMDVNSMHLILKLSAVETFQNVYDQFQKHR